jgi:hypothetical protein
MDAEVDINGTTHMFAKLLNCINVSTIVFKKCRTGKLCACGNVGNENLNHDCFGSMLVSI